MKTKLFIGLWVLLIAKPILAAAPYCAPRPNVLDGILRQTLGVIKSVASPATPRVVENSKPAKDQAKPEKSKKSSPAVTPTKKATDMSNISDEVKQILSLPNIEDRFAGYLFLQNKGVKLSKAEESLIGASISTLAFDLPEELDFNLINLLLIHLEGWSGDKNQKFSDIKVFETQSEPFWISKFKTIKDDPEALVDFRKALFRHILKDPLMISGNDKELNDYRSGLLLLQFPVFSFLNDLKNKPSVSEIINFGEAVISRMGEALIDKDSDGISDEVAGLEKFQSVLGRVFSAEEFKLWMDIGDVSDLKLDEITSHMKEYLSFKSSNRYFSDPKNQGAFDKAYFYGDAVLKQAETMFDSENARRVLAYQRSISAEDVVMMDLKSRFVKPITGSPQVNHLFQHVNEGGLFVEKYFQNRQKGTKVPLDLYQRFSAAQSYALLDSKISVESYSTFEHAKTNLRDRLKEPYAYLLTMPLNDILKLNLIKSYLPNFKVSDLDRENVKTSLSKSEQDLYVLIEALDYELYAIFGSQRPSLEFENIEQAKTQIPLLHEQLSNWKKLAPGLSPALFGWNGSEKYHHPFPVKATPMPLVEFYKNQGNLPAEILTVSRTWSPDSLINSLKEIELELVQEKEAKVRELSEKWKLETSKYFAAEKEAESSGKEDALKKDFSNWTLPELRAALFLLSRFDSTTVIKIDEKTKKETKLYQNLLEVDGLSNPAAAAALLSEAQHIARKEGLLLAIYGKDWAEKLEKDPHSLADQLAASDMAIDAFDALKKYSLEVFQFQKGTASGELIAPPTETFNTKVFQPMIEKLVELKVISPQDAEYWKNPHVSRENGYASIGVGAEALLPSLLKESAAVVFYINHQAFASSNPVAKKMENLKPSFQEILNWLDHELNDFSSWSRNGDRQWTAESMAEELALATSRNNLDQKFLELLAKVLAEKIIESRGRSVDGDALTSLEALVKHLGLESSPFTSRLLKVLHQSIDKQLDFASRTHGPLHDLLVYGVTSARTDAKSNDIVSNLQIKILSTLKRDVDTEEKVSARIAQAVQSDIPKQQKNASEKFDQMRQPEKPFVRVEEDLLSFIKKMPGVAGVVTKYYKLFGADKFLQFENITKELLSKQLMSKDFVLRMAFADAEEFKASDENPVKDFEEKMRQSLPLALSKDVSAESVFFLQLVGFLDDENLLNRELGKSNLTQLDREELLKRKEILKARQKIIVEGLARADLDWFRDSFNQATKHWIESYKELSESNGPFSRQDLRELVVRLQMDPKFALLLLFGENELEQGNDLGDRGDFAKKLKSGEAQAILTAIGWEAKYQRASSKEKKLIENQLFLLRRFLNQTIGLFPDNSDLPALANPIATLLGINLIADTIGSDAEVVVETQRTDVNTVQKKVLTEKFSSIDSLYKTIDVDLNGLGSMADSLIESDVDVQSVLDSLHALFEWRRNEELLKVDPDVFYEDENITYVASPVEGRFPDRFPGYKLRKTNVPGEMIIGPYGYYGTLIKGIFYPISSRPKKNPQWDAYLAPLKDAGLKIKDPAIRSQWMQMIDKLAVQKDRSLKVNNESLRLKNFVGFGGPYAKAFGDFKAEVDHQRWNELYGAGGSLLVWEIASSGRKRLAEADPQNLVWSQLAEFKHLILASEFELSGKKFPNTNDEKAKINGILAGEKNEDDSKHFRFELTELSKTKLSDPRKYLEIWRPIQSAMLERQTGRAWELGQKFRVTDEELDKAIFEFSALTESPQLKNFLVKLGKAIKTPHVISAANSDFVKNLQDSRFDLVQATVEDSLAFADQQFAGVLRSVPELGSLKVVTLFENGSLRKDIESRPQVLEIGFNALSEVLFTLNLRHQVLASIAKSMQLHRSEANKLLKDDAKNNLKIKQMFDVVLGTVGYKVVSEINNKDIEKINTHLNKVFDILDLAKQGQLQEGQWLDLFENLKGAIKITSGNENPFDSSAIAKRFSEDTASNALFLASYLINVFSSTVEALGKIEVPEIKEADWKSIKDISSSSAWSEFVSVLQNKSFDGILIPAFHVPNTNSVLSSSEFGDRYLATKGGREAKYISSRENTRSRFYKDVEETTTRSWLSDKKYQKSKLAYAYGDPVKSTLEKFRNFIKNDYENRYLDLSPEQRVILQILGPKGMSLTNSDSADAKTLSEAALKVVNSISKLKDNSRLLGFESQMIDVLSRLYINDAKSKEPKGVSLSDFIEELTSSIMIAESDKESILSLATDYFAYQQAVMTLSIFSFVLDKNSQPKDLNSLFDEVRSLQTYLSLTPEEIVDGLDRIWTHRAHQVAKETHAMMKHQKANQNKVITFLTSTFQGIGHFIQGSLFDPLAGLVYRAGEGLYIRSLLWSSSDARAMREIKAIGGWGKDPTELSWRERQSMVNELRVNEPGQAYAQLFWDAATIAMFWSPIKNGAKIKPMVPLAPATGRFAGVRNSWRSVKEYLSRTPYHSGSFVGGGVQKLGFETAKDSMALKASAELLAKAERAALPQPRLLSSGWRALKWPIYRDGAKRFLKGFGAFTVDTAVFSAAISAPMAMLYPETYQNNGWSTFLSEVLSAALFMKGMGYVHQGLYAIGQKFPVAAYTNYYLSKGVLNYMGGQVVKPGLATFYAQHIEGRSYSKLPKDPSGFPLFEKDALGNLTPEGERQQKEFYQDYQDEQTSISHIAILAYMFVGGPLVHKGSQWTYQKAGDALSGKVSRPKDTKEEEIRQHKESLVSKMSDLYVQNRGDQIKLAEIKDKLINDRDGLIFQQAKLVVGPKIHAQSREMLKRDFEEAWNKGMQMGRLRLEMVPAVQELATGRDLNQPIWLYAKFLESADRMSRQLGISPQEALRRSFEDIGVPDFIVATTGTRGLNTGISQNNPLFGDFVLSRLAELKQSNPSRYEEIMLERRASNNGEPGLVRSIDIDQFSRLSPAFQQEVLGTTNVIRPNPSNPLVKTSQIYRQEWNREAQRPELEAPIGFERVFLDQGIRQIELNGLRQVLEARAIGPQAPVVTVNPDKSILYSQGPLTVHLRLQDNGSVSWTISNVSAPFETTVVAEAAPLRRGAAPSLAHESAADLRKTLATMGVRIVERSREDERAVSEVVTPAAPVREQRLKIPLGSQLWANMKNLQRNTLGNEVVLREWGNHERFKIQEVVFEDGSSQLYLTRNHQVNPQLRDVYKEQIRRIDELKSFNRENYRQLDQMTKLDRNGLDKHEQVLRDKIETASKELDDLRRPLREDEQGNTRTVPLEATLEIKTKEEVLGYAKSLYEKQLDLVLRLKNGEVIDTKKVKAYHSYHSQYLEILETRAERSVVWASGHAETHALNFDKSSHIQGYRINPETGLVMLDSVFGTTQIDMATGKVKIYQRNLLIPEQHRESTLESLAAEHNAMISVGLPRALNARGDFDRGFLSLIESHWKKEKEFENATPLTNVESRISETGESSPRTESMRGIFGQEPLQLPGSNPE